MWAWTECLNHLRFFTKFWLSLSVFPHTLSFIRAGHFLRMLVSSDAALQQFRLAARGEEVHVGFDWSIIHQCAPGSVLSNPGATTEQMYRAGWLLPIERGDAEQDSVLFSGLGNKPHAVSLVAWHYGRFSPVMWDTMGDCVNIEGWN